VSMLHASLRFFALITFFPFFLGLRKLNFITRLRLNLYTLTLLVLTSFSIVSHFEQA